MIFINTEIKKSLINTENKISCLKNSEKLANEQNIAMLNPIMTKKAGE